MYSYPETFAVFSSKHAITVKVKDNCLRIDSLATYTEKQTQHPEKTSKDFAIEIGSHVRGVKYIADGHLFPDVTHILRQYRKAVRLIENAVVNPHTYLGKKRLMKEFELLITDE
jgi:hypothetical protein